MNLKWLILKKVLKSAPTPVKTRLTGITTTPTTTRKPATSTSTWITTATTTTIRIPNQSRGKKKFARSPAQTAKSRRSATPRLGAEKTLGYTDFVGASKHPFKWHLSKKILENRLFKRWQYTHPLWTRATSTRATLLLIGWKSRKRDLLSRILAYWSHLK